ncbi:endonuclease III [candidate division TA06 bacterium]|uniref:Endonuclease III n=1 Tax=candidate division TA06 bacterium TaxID=2250710 RepID=A0A660SKV6_UNCT6|nr:MAG: endonuclease III [candidate division TA06 bacterium]
MKTETLLNILKILEKTEMKAPIVTLIKERTNDPYQILISTILSLRTKDNVTAVASKKLFQKAYTPLQMLKLNKKEIEKLIFPVGFYHRKAENILEISKTLVENYNAKVPSNIDELLKFKGVGRKTANLVVTLGFGKPGICVDTHVHRISNRFGYVKTKTPDKTEIVLRKKLPIDWWIRYNDLLVAFGQTICKPISPLCSKCPVVQYCPKIGVKTHR